MIIPGGPNTLGSDPRDNTSKAGYQRLGMEVREHEESNYESRIRRPYHQDID